jgi:hypothetical protein
MKGRRIRPKRLGASLIVFAGVSGSGTFLVLLAQARTPGQLLLSLSALWLASLTALLGVVLASRPACTEPRPVRASAPPRGLHRTPASAERGHREVWRRRAGA